MAAPRENAVYAVNQGGLPRPCHGLAARGFPDACFELKSVLEEWNQVEVKGEAGSHPVSKIPHRLFVVAARKS